MRIFLILLIIAGAGYFGWQAIQTAPPENIPQAVVENTQQAPEVLSINETTEAQSEEVIFSNETVRIGFTGYGPGKEHTGSLAVQSSDLRFTEGKLTGVVVVDMNSITADVPAVATHLKNKDFFDAARFPTARFEITSLANSTLVGNLTIRGITRQISVPVSISDTAYTSEFRLSMNNFGISQRFANDEFVVRVTVPRK